MKSDDLSETPLQTETVFLGKLLNVKRDLVRLANGHEAVREYISHPGATLVIPVLDINKLVMERQYRHPLQRTFIELPAGKIDPGEDPLTTGQRELLEETGYEAAEWRHLTTIHPCIGYSNEAIHIYLATQLTAGEHCRNQDETLEVLTLPLGEALGMVRNGEITDAKTVIALFWAEKVLCGDWR